MTGNELIFWTYSAATALTVVAGLLATRVRREWLTSLPMAHVAALVLVALYGWEALVYLPGTIAQYTTRVAGIPDPAGVEASQAFVIASAAFVAAAAVAIYGILRLRPWGVLGIGVAATRVAMSVAGSIQLFSTNLDLFGPEALGYNVIIAFALSGLPAVVGVVLLVWPLLRTSRVGGPPVETADWSGEPSPEAGR